MQALRTTLALVLFITLCGCSHAPARRAAGASPQPAPAAAARTEDPWLWLEQTRGDRVMAWVDQQNAITEKRFASDDSFHDSQARILDVLNSEARIAYPDRMGQYLYNFWKDRQHPRGLWRRTTLAEYRKPDPSWETVLDVDALGKAEGHPWVFKGAQCLKPSYRRCLVSLSPKGGDAVAVREFDTVSKTFVKDGFRLPEAKTQVGWIDRDHIFVGTDFGPGSMTTSSYPRIVKRWTRGTPLADADSIYEGKASDLGVFAYHDDTPAFERNFLMVYRDTFHADLFQIRSDRLVHVDVPMDAQASPHRQWLLVETKSPWTTGGTTWPAGALLVIRFDDFMAGKRDFTALFTPDAHTALSSYNWTRHHLILNTLHDVQNRLQVLTAGSNGGWSRKPLSGAPDLSTVRVVDTDPDQSDAYWLDVSGYLTPSTLKRGVLGKSRAVTVKQAPAFFDADRFQVSQHFATSRDGTRVPYFEIAPKGIEPDGSHRTLLYGYGGFEVSLLPDYSGSIGRAWLERGGVYVVANIRGGGEYGPRWHKAALKADRPKAYQDFAAVARDLIRRGVTSPKHLGAEGGSNGGLLMGNMLVGYPELFGAIACEVPLLDMKRYTHLDAGASWIGEYGDPDDPGQWAYIKTFSPYQRVKPGQDYPPVLFYTTTSDDRVGPAQARKMAARMQHMGYDKVWFYENTEGGHGAGADNRQTAHMHALAWNFLWEELR